MSASTLQRQTLKNELPHLSPPVESDPRLECYPPPLPDKYKGHLQWYGFPFYEDYMKKFALENHPQIIEKGFLSCLLWFIQRLSFHAHCGGIRIKSAVADEETTPPGVRVFTGPMTGLRQFRVIAITAWEKSAWDHRPTMKQVEVLSQILGMEPQWFTDVTPPEVYLDNDY